MTEILSNVADKTGLAVASCIKVSKYAVGFGLDNAQRMKAALLALAAAMACDTKNFAQLPPFVTLHLF